MKTNPPKTQSRPLRQRSTLLAALFALTFLLAWTQWRALASTTDTYQVSLRQLARMRVDSARIQALQQAPQAAVSRVRPNEQLLSQVEKALAAANLPRAKWHDSIPQPPVRPPKSDYLRFTTRLYFRDIGLKKLAAFADQLGRQDAALRVSGININNRDSGTSGYDVDVGVSYLVFEPLGQ